MKVKFNYKGIWCLTPLCLLLSLVGCSRQKESLKKDIVKLQSRKVNIPLDLMLCFNGLLTTAPNPDKLKFKLIIYTDSVSCFSCSLNRLFYWTPLIDSLKPSIDFVFILSPKANELDKVKDVLRLGNLNYPVYIDTCSAFIKANPHIPDNNLMHTFLLNNKDSVVLVGNPLSTPKIKEILINIIKSDRQ